MSFLIPPGYSPSFLEHFSNQFSHLMQNVDVKKVMIEGAIATGMADVLWHYKPGLLGKISQAAATAFSLISLGALGKAAYESKDEHSVEKWIAFAAMAGIHTFRINRYWKDQARAAQRAAAQQPPIVVPPLLTEAEKNRLEQEVVNLRAEIKELEKMIKIQAQEKTILIEEHGNAIAFGEKLKEIHANSAETHAELAKTNEKEAKELKTAKAKLKQEVKGLKTEIQTLNETIKCQDQEKATLTEEHGNLLAESEKEKKDHAGLQEKYRMLSDAAQATSQLETAQQVKQVSVFEQEIQGLNHHIETLVKQHENVLADNYGEFVSLRQKLQAGGELIAKLEAGLVDAGERKASVEQQMQEQQTILDQLQLTLKEKEAQLEIKEAHITAIQVSKKEQESIYFSTIKTIRERKNQVEESKELLAKQLIDSAEANKILHDELDELKKTILIDPQAHQDIKVELEQAKQALTLKETELAEALQRMKQDTEAHSQEQAHNLEENTALKGRVTDLTAELQKTKEMYESESERATQAEQRDTENREFISSLVTENDSHVAKIRDQAARIRELETQLKRSQKEAKRMCSGLADLVVTQEEKQRQESNQVDRQIERVNKNIQSARGMTASGNLEEILNPDSEITNQEIEVPTEDMTHDQNWLEEKALSLLKNIPKPVNNVGFTDILHFLNNKVNKYKFLTEQPAKIEPETEAKAETEAETETEAKAETEAETEAETKNVVEEDWGNITFTLATEEVDRINQRNNRLAMYEKAVSIVQQDFEAFKKEDPVDDFLEREKKRNELKLRKAVPAQQETIPTPPPAPPQSSAPTPPPAPPKTMSSKSGALKPQPATTASKSEPANEAKKALCSNIRSFNVGELKKVDKSETHPKAKKPAPIQLVDILALAIANRRDNLKVDENDDSVEDANWGDDD